MARKTIAQLEEDIENLKATVGELGGKVTAYRSQALNFQRDKDNLKAEYEKKLLELNKFIGDQATKIRNLQDLSNTVVLKSTELLG